METLINVIIIKYKMTDLIYAIRIHHIESADLSILHVKIGKTRNIKSIVRQYKRSSSDVKLLDLWKSNESLNLSECERGVHKLAEKYAYKRENEKFTFLQKGYEDFSQNISNLLKKYDEGEIGKKKGKSLKAMVSSEEDLISNKKSEISKLYLLLKQRILDLDEKIIFNPQKYYISLRKTKNFAFIKLRKSKIRIIIMVPYEESRKLIKFHEIIKLGTSVQKFYHEPCFAVNVLNHEKLSEIIETIKIARDRAE